MTQHLTQATQAKLVAAIEDGVRHTDAGLHPNEALAKAADAHQIGAGYLDTMVHAFNTGRTNRQRREGATLAEKIADFPLADANIIRQTLFPDTVKTAAQHHNDTAVSTDYGVSPRGFLERRQKAAFLKEAATLNMRMSDAKSPVYPKDPRDAMRQASSKVDVLNRQVDDSRRAAAGIMNKAGATFNSMVTYFRQPRAIPLPVFKENLGHLHGDVGTQLADAIGREAPHLLKLAQHRNSESALVPGAKQNFDTERLAPAVGEPYDLAARLFSELDAYRVAKEAHTILEEKHRKEAEDLLRPFAVPSNDMVSVVGDPSLQIKSAVGAVKTLGSAVLLNSLMNSAASGLRGPSDESLLKKNLESLTDPEHEMKLRGINTQAMLQDFILNDPVISGFDPNQVTDSFNELTQLSPHATDQRLLMQSLLRKKLQQGNLDQFEIDQLLGMEDKLRKRTLSPAAQFGGGGDGSIVH